MRSDSRLKHPEGAQKALEGTLFHLVVCGLVVFGGSGFKRRLKIAMVSWPEISIRYYNHASFAINIPAEEPILTSDTVAKIINCGMTHYTLGMRAYYLAVPFSLWLFGPLWMLIGTIVLTIILCKLDRTD